MRADGKSKQPLKTMENPTTVKGAAMARIECDDLFSELARQYTEIKVCHDEEDGYFLKCESIYKGIDAWVAMDAPEAPKRETVTDAIVAAVEWHNADLRPSMEWRKPISLPEAVEYLIDVWHESETDLALHEYLGWTREQYARWVETGNLPSQNVESSHGGLDCNNHQTRSPAVGCDDLL